MLILSLWIVFVFSTGLAIGSFLNVCVARLPYEKSLIWPASPRARHGPRRRLPAAARPLPHVRPAHLLALPVGGAVHRPGVRRAVLPGDGRQRPRPAGDPPARLVGARAGAAGGTHQPRWW